MAPPASGPHQVSFTGPMVLGGSAYSMAELEQVPPVRAVSTGHPGLDAFMGGGFAPGTVCGISGPPRSGVTRLALHIAAAATRRVLVVNDHVPTLLLRDQLRTLTANTATRAPTPETASCSLGDEGSGLALASWLPLPDWREPLGWEGANYDLVVSDCYDEMVRPAGWPSVLDAVRARRWLRELARRTGTTLVLTARTSTPGAPGRPGAYGTGEGCGGIHDRWTCGDMMRVVLDDVCDVSVEVEGQRGSGTHEGEDGRGYVVYQCQARGRGSAGVTLSIKDET